MLGCHGAVVSLGSSVVRLPWCIGAVVSLGCLLLRCHGVGFCVARFVCCYVVMALVVVLLGSSVVRLPWRCFVARLSVVTLSWRWLLCC